VARDRARPENAANGFVPPQAALPSVALRQITPAVLLSSATPARDLGSAMATPATFSLQAHGFSPRAIGIQVARLSRARTSERFGISRSDRRIRRDTVRAAERSGMKRNFRRYPAGAILTLAIVTLSTLAGSGPAKAEEEAGTPPAQQAGVEPTEQAKPKEPREGLGIVDDTFDSIKEWTLEKSGITLGMGFSSSWQYGFNRPDNHKLSLRVLDKDHNKFSVDLFQITLKRDPVEKGQVGFMFQGDTGRYARRLKSDWNGSGLNNDTDWERTELDLQQAYLAYNTPIGNGLLLKLGKFNTLVGSEVNEPWNNPTYSRSLIYGFAQPATHTGGLASYNFTDQVNLTLGGIVGWDVVTDNNKSTSFIGQLGLLPNSVFNFFITGIYGPEMLENNHDPRSLLDLVAVIKPTDKLQLLTNYDYGIESSGSIDGSGDNSVFWGISQIFVYSFTEKIDGVFRAEWFEDAGGARTGATQRIWDLTVDGKYKLTDYMYTRLEYRHAESDHKPFLTGSDIFLAGQDSVAIELGYAF
jgi:hypothetical protein